MKRLSKQVMIALMSLLVLYQTGYAQTQKLTQEQWQQEMQNEELQINRYIDQRLKDPTPKEVLNNLKADAHHDPISRKNKPAAITALSRAYYRDQYFQLHPEAAKIYNPGRVSDNNSAAPDGNTAQKAANYNVVSCNGNFDDGNLSSYAGFQNSGYRTGVCSFVPPSSVPYAPVPLTGSPDNFLLTNNVPDPIVPALRQTNAGSAHAMRINSYDPCYPGYGVNMLQKRLPAASTSGKYRVNFSYAMVFEDFHGIGSGFNPFFLARVLNAAGVEVGTRVCRVADMTNPFYQTLPNSPSGFCRTYSGLVWRDWTCAYIEFNAVAGQQYTVEFFTADCGGGAHFGYAYVDDICAGSCCPKFMIQDCCQFRGGGSTNPACCDVCSAPNDPFTIYVIDEYGSLVPTSDYSISWSHDPGNTTSSTLLLPNQKTVVTVTSLDGSCVWRDTFQKFCCNDTATIVPILSWDPCNIQNQQRAITFKVKNESGTIMTSAAGYTFFWEYGGYITSTADSVVGYPFQMPIYVTVVDPVSKCVYKDTFEFYCCRPTVPANPGCWSESGNKVLFWNRVPNAAYYKLKLNINDTRCGCSEINPPGLIEMNVYDTTITLPASIAACYSWQVASVCPDSAVSAFSTSVCYCPTRPTCTTPTGLQCQIVFVPDITNPGMYMVQRQISWTAVPGALSYEIDMVIDDPSCCAASPSIIMGMMATSTTNTYIPPSHLGCYSWRVRAICPGGMTSAWSTSTCSCGWVVAASKPGNENTDAAMEKVFGPNDHNIKVMATPNPASDHINFTIGFGKDDYQNLTLSVVDLNGREVARRDITNNTVIKVDVREFSSGTYLYLIRDNNKILYSNKVLIQK